MWTFSLHLEPLCFEAGLCCSLLVINVKCTPARRDWIRVIVLFYHVNSDLEGAVLDVGAPEVGVPHCLTALRRDGRLRGGGFV